MRGDIFSIPLINDDFPYSGVYETAAPKKTPFVSTKIAPRALSFLCSIFGLNQPNIYYTVSNVDIQKVDIGAAFKTPNGDIFFEKRKNMHWFIKPANTENAYRLVLERKNFYNGVWVYDYTDSYNFKALTINQAYMYVHKI